MQRQRPFLIASSPSCVALMAWPSSSRNPVCQRYAKQIRPGLVRLLNALRLRLTDLCPESFGAPCHLHKLLHLHPSPATAQAHLLQADPAAWSQLPISPSGMDYGLTAQCMHDPRSCCSAPNRPPRPCTRVCPPASPVICSLGRPGTRTQSLHSPSM